MPIGQDGSHGKGIPPMVNSPLIRPYFLGGVGIGGVPLGSYEGGSGEICRFSMALLEENGQAIFGGGGEKGNDTIFF